MNDVVHVVEVVYKVHYWVSNMLYREESGFLALSFALGSVS